MNKQFGCFAMLLLAMVFPLTTAQARYLNPNTGRFQTMDSYEGNSADHASLHKYAYAHNDPVNRIDPSGFASYIGFDTVGWNNYGHVGIITFNPTNRIYTRFDHAHGIVAQKTNSTAQALFLGYHILFVIPDEYDLAIDTARKNYKKHPGGSTMSNNCRTSVMEILDEAKFPYPLHDGVSPNGWLTKWWKADYPYILKDKRGALWIKKNIRFSVPSTFNLMLMDERVEVGY